MLVHHFLTDSAEQFPGKTALIHSGRKFTYEQVWQKSVAVGNTLQSLGVQRGDRIGIYLNNSIQYVAGYYGTLMAGAVTVPLNTGCSPEVVRQTIDRAGIDVLLTEKRFHPALETLPRIRAVISTGQLSAVPADTALRFDELESSSEVCPLPRPLGTDELASIVFTSGSTGPPKGVMLSHGNIVANTDSIVQYLNLTRHDRVLDVLPFAYVYGKSLLNTHFRVGGSLVLENSFVFPNVVLDSMVREEVTGIAGVPSTFTILLERSSLEQHHFPALRYLTQAGGPMVPAVIKAVAAAFPSQQLFIMYGATEASARLTYLNPARLRDKLGSVGQAIPGVRIEIQRIDGSRADPGEEGEIVAFGDNIMQGYWEDPEGTAHALRGGGYHTGDLAYCDDDGFIFIRGRRDDMMKIGGRRVSPREIEEVVSEMAGVSEAAVLAVADEILGQVPCAFVSLSNDSVADHDILEHCRQRLPTYKVPRHVQIVDSIPKNENGKISKARLLESARPAAAGQSD